MTENQRVRVIFTMCYDAWSLFLSAFHSKCYSKQQSALLLACFTAPLQQSMTAVSYLTLPPKYFNTFNSPFVYHTRAFMPISAPSAGGRLTSSR